MAAAAVFTTPSGAVVTAVATAVVAGGAMLASMDTASVGSEVDSKTASITSACLYP